MASFGKPKILLGCKSQYAPRFLGLHINPSSILLADTKENQFPAIFEELILEIWQLLFTDKVKSWLQLMYELCMLRKAVYFCETELIFIIIYVFHKLL